MYHLKMEEPEKKYFKWKENICAKFDKYWDYLMPEKIRTPTWHNTVAGCISTHNALFKSGFEETQQNGYWALAHLEKPCRDGFSSSTRLKETNKELKTGIKSEGKGGVNGSGTGANRKKKKKRPNTEGEKGGEEVTSGKVKIYYESEGSSIDEDIILSDGEGWSSDKSVEEYNHSKQLFIQTYTYKKSGITQKLR
ncbi:Cysteine-rich protein 2-binding protein [Zancudomyces culisetae]|uniref:Cysteine-rich protein 2-binding protein n=1 Tax=Zancudomyces culisetae TaxID=1213189 RepID=A0A1R1PQ51_ZANCU|nr:Cysteine-rich protein 2-binding protein [Zancudomyces culisetae]|eukprot:OMH83078.1 Cysteine-rich protein 2-binding protein [Zancudomyces culisetae]